MTWSLGGAAVEHRTFDQSGRGSIPGQGAIKSLG